MRLQEAAAINRCFAIAGDLSAPLGPYDDALCDHSIRRVAGKRRGTREHLGLSRKGIRKFPTPSYGTHCVPNTVF